jgi:putative Mn2+ efflux pump MntP
MSMSKKTVGVALLVVGVLLFLVSAAADSLGIGGSPGIGMKQVAGIVGGVVLAAIGMVRLRSRQA